MTILRPTFALAFLFAVASPVPAEPSPDWWSRVQQGIADSEYEISRQPDGWQAPNRSQNFRTTFTEAGIRVVPRTEAAPSWTWGLTWIGYGRGETTWGVPAASLDPKGARIDYRRGPLAEWYDNSRRGLKQGFVMTRPPEELNGARRDDSGAPIHLDLALSGDLRPVISEDRLAIDFEALAGARVLHYADLEVSDARQTKLKAWMEGFARSDARGIRIVIDDRDALYPITVDPLATSPAWTAEGDQAGARLGFSVATAGDVNGDGYSDVIVGAPYYDNGQPDEGRALVYLGSASGLSASPSWTAESNQANAYFGIAVATAGDVDLDGYHCSDVIVGAPSYDNGEIDEGRAYLYLGSRSGLAPSPAWTAEGDQVGARFGFSVATAGSVNPDLYSDVIVGAYAYDNGQPDEGRAYVYLGSDTGLEASPAWTAEGNQPTAYFGWSVAMAGDVNGDTYSDVIVGAYAHDDGQSDEGRAYVYLGSYSGLAASPAWTAEGDQVGASFGGSVATAGDVNGDGYSDVIVGSFGYDNGETDEGRAFVYLGGATGLAWTSAWATENDQASTYLGYSVGTAGDVNGDGYADIVVGAYAYDNGQTDEGRGYVYLGSAAGLPVAAAWIVEGNQDYAYFGKSVATAGDVNGDGYSDLIVGADAYDNAQTDEGRAFVFQGSASGLAATAGWTAEGNAVEAEFGYSVATAGDVNADGYSDVLVGAPAYDGGGRAYLYLGSPAGTATTAAWTAESEPGIRTFGRCVATAGDVNGDGYADVIVAAVEYTISFEQVGHVYVYLGSGAGLAASPTWAASSALVDDNFGYSVASAGDVNGDGYSDIIVGANNLDYGAGRVYVYLGSAAGLSTSASWTADGEQPFSFLGESVATAGDVNGDGYSDIIVGATGAGDGGRAYVFLGAPSGPGTTPAWTGEGNQPDARFGGSVATAGDVDGDGYSDVVVGAHLYDNGQTDEGRAYVYSGSASGLATAPTWVAEGDRAASYFGISVATAGDVNGDGYSDVIVGASNYWDVESWANYGRASVYLGSASGLMTTPAWTADGSASEWSETNFGRSVATAGDVNGDGYSDVIVGAYRFENDQIFEGATFLYYGNGGRGIPLHPEQLHGSCQPPIAPLGYSGDPTWFCVSLKARTPYGKGAAAIRVEAKPLGELFDGFPTSGSPFQGTGIAGTDIYSYVPTLPGERVHWRARLRYDPVTVPFQPWSRWVTGSWNGAQETDLRTRALADFTLTQTDRVDPVLAGGTITYDVDIQNLGPDALRARLVDTIPTGATFVSAIGSGATCTHASGVVTCDFDPTPIDTHRNVAITVIAGPAGTATNTAHVHADGRDPVAGNDIAVETTAVLVPGIGNFVWMDYDADGVQDSVEPGQSGTIVALYRQDGTFLGSTITDAGGAYAFTNLTHGEYYYLRFFPPEPLVLSPRDQGVDDLADSDPDPATGRTITFGLLHEHDVSRWDAGVKWDGDGDGHTVWYNDCDDADPSVYPGAPQICDGHNNDCNDPSWPTAPTDEQDNDGDGYRYCGGDCSDLNPNWFPGQVEICDGIDDDCDGLVDEGCDGTCDLPAESADEIDLAPSAFNTGSPRLAWTGSSYGVVYSDLQNGNQDVYFARLDAQLNRIGADVRVTSHTSNSLSPQIVWTGTYFGVTWQDDRDGNYEIYFTLLNTFGASLTGDVRVTNAVGTSRMPRIAWSGLDFGVVWNDTRDGTLENWFVRLGVYGQPLAAERRITTTPHESNNARMVWNGSVYGFVYNDFRDGDYEIYFQAIDRAGNTVTPETRLTTASGVSRMPALAWDGAGAQFGVVWVDARSGADQLFFTRIAANGTKLTGDHPLAPIQNPSGAIVSIVHTGAEFGLAWWEQSAGNPEVYFGRLAGDALREAPIRLTDDPATSQMPSVDWNGSEYVVGFSDDHAGASVFHPMVTRVACCTVSTLGDRVWRDADVDGIQDPGESGVPGTLVAVYDGTGALLGASSSGADGAYQLTGLSCGSTYELRFFPPGSEYLAPRNQGADDALDSDPDPATGSTGTFVLASSADAAGWDAGIAACWPPDEPVYIASVGRTNDGNNYPILNFQDPNQPEQITGYDVYRSDTPGAAWPWPLVATDVVDMDAATPNLQWVDTSGDVSPTGAWYYQVTAYNHRCPAEGPR